MDSFGIGVLLNALSYLATQHVSLVLVCPTRRSRPFEVTGLRAACTIFATRDEALPSSRPAPVAHGWRTTRG